MKLYNDSRKNMRPDYVYLMNMYSDRSTVFGADISYLVTNEIKLSDLSFMKGGSVQSKVKFYFRKGGKLSLY